MFLGEGKIEQERKKGGKKKGRDRDHLIFRPVFQKKRKKKKETPAQKHAKQNMQKNPPTHRPNKKRTQGKESFRKAFRIVHQRKGALTPPVRRPTAIHPYIQKCISQLRPHRPITGRIPGQSKKKGELGKTS